MRYISFFLLTTLIATLINNNCTVVDFVLNCASIIIIIYGIKRFNIFNNFCIYFVLASIIIPMFIMPSWHLVSEYNVEHPQKMYDIIVPFGAKISFFISLLWLVFGRIQKKSSRNHTPVIIKPELVPLRQFKRVSCCIIILSLFSYSIGLGRMGAEAVVLPFHLGGIIFFIFSTFFPYYTAALVENRLKNNKVVEREIFIYYTIWSLLMMVVRLSKGVLITNMIPLFVVYVFYKGWNLKKYMKVAAPVIAIFLFLYPIIATMRTIDSGGSIVDVFKESKEQVDDSNDKENTLLVVLNRVFPNASYYAIDNDYISSDLFDFSKAPLVYLYGGAAGYQTHYIEGYSEDAHHSSGTSSLVDPLLHGGYGFCYIVMFLIMLYAFMIDNRLYKMQITTHVILFMILFEFATGSNVSKLYDATGIQWFLANVIMILYVNKMNYQIKA